MSLKLALVLIVIVLAGCLDESTYITSRNTDETTTKTNVENANVNPQTVQFESIDGYSLVGTYWKNPASTKPPVVLVHQFSRDRHTYDAFAKKLFDNGFRVLSFDLRGHGESTQKKGNTVDYSSFTDRDYAFIVSDIFQAKQFLNAEEIMVVGASVSANATLLYASQDPSSPGVVLLSPGINFRGIDITVPARQKDVPLLVVASREDTYSAQTAQSLFTGGPLIDKKLIILEDAGHGTDMFLGNADLAQSVVDWLNEHAP